MKESEKPPEARKNRKVHGKLVVRPLERIWEREMICAQGSWQRSFNV